MLQQNCFAHSGWICVRKHCGITSNRLLMQIKKLFGCKVGYVGTLDPFAEGVLPIALNQACKYISYLPDSTKEYTFRMFFGYSTDTFDCDGNICASGGVIPSAIDLSDALQSFVGTISQTPPAFSAIKVNGRRAYDLCRRGDIVQIPPRNVHIFLLQMLEYGECYCKHTDLVSQRGFYAKMRCVCSSGTYIRSLAVDLAKSVDALCHVDELLRTRSGSFVLEKSFSLEELQKMYYNGDVCDAVQSVESALDDIPALYTDRVDDIRCGREVIPLDAQADGIFRVFCDKTHEFIGLVEVCDGILRALRLCAY